MGGRGDQANITVLLPVCPLIITDSQQARIFPLGSGVWLHGNVVITGNLDQSLFQLPDHGQVTRHLVFGGEGVNTGKFRPETGSISAAALSFMVHEPSGIMP